MSYIWSSTVSPLYSTDSFSQVLYPTVVSSSPFTPVWSTPEYPDVVITPNIRPISPFHALPGVTVTAPSNMINKITNSYLQLPLDPTLNLNEDINVQNQVTKYFYYKTLDAWLHDDFTDVLDKVKSKEKIKYIEENVFSKHDMKQILKQFRKETDTNWYDMQKNKMFIKDIVHKFLLKKVNQKS